MTKTIALACLAVLAFSTAAKADDQWFDKYDHNHDGHWNYNEFKKAHSQWWKAHKNEKRITDAELRAQYNSWEASHHGWADREQVRGYHNW